MAKYCAKCGTKLDDNASFCNNCGNATTTNEQVNVNVNVNNTSTNSTPLVAKREIVLAIILSLITCGIYSLYWFIVMTDEVNKVSNDNRTSGGLALLYTILTCGIYGIYWHYKMGKQIYLSGQTYGKDISDNSVVYLLLGLFGFGIVSYALIQNDLNKFAA